MGGHRHRLDLVMGHVEEGRAQIAVDALQLDPQVGAKLGVERGQRFVHQVDARVAHQGPTDGHALHLAARQARGLVVEFVRDPKDFGDFLHPLGDLVLGPVA